MDDALVPSTLRDVICWERKALLSERLLGEERLGQAALHAVSQVMGHTGIYRTLESYQHLLDLVLGLYVSRQAIQPAFPQAVHASMHYAEGADRPVATGFSRNKSARFGSARKARGGYTVPSPPHTLESPTTVGKGWRRLPSMNSRKDSFQGMRKEDPGPHRSAQHLLARHRFGGEGSIGKLQSDWNIVWTILTSGEETTKELRESLELSDATFVKWQSRYRHILGCCFQRQTGRGRTGRGLPGPVGQNALSVVNRMWLNYPKELDEMGPGLLLTFLSNFDESASLSRFSSKEDAVRFAQFLRAVGVEGKHITLAQGHAGDFKGLKSGEIPSFPVTDHTGTLYNTRPAPEAFLRKPYTDHRFALWISYRKDETSLALSIGSSRSRGTAKGKPSAGGADNKVNYAYRFALAMVAIVSDQVWAEEPAVPAAHAN